MNCGEFYLLHTGSSDESSGDDADDEEYKCSNSDCNQLI